jgi:hypothetical protein
MHQILPLSLNSTFSEDLLNSIPIRVKKMSASLARDPQHLIEIQIGSYDAMRIPIALKTQRISEFCSGRHRKVSHKG